MNLARLAILSLAGLADQAAMGETPRERFEREYPAAWARLQHAYEHVEARGILRRWWASGEARPSYEVHCRISFPNARVEARRLLDEASAAGGTGHEWSVVFGPDVSFHARRGSSGDRWAVTAMERGTGQPTGFRPADDERVTELECYPHYEQLAGLFVETPCRLYSWPLIRVLDPGRYRIESVEEDVFEGQRLVRVSYRGAPGQSPRITGRMELLPDLGWVVRLHSQEGERYAINAADAVPKRIVPFRQKATVTYGAVRDGVAAPVSARFEDSVGGVGVMEFERFELGVKTPASAFTPGAYGLPDLSVPVEQVRRWNRAVWLVPAVMLGVLAVWLMRRPGRQGAS